MKRGRKRLLPLAQVCPICGKTFTPLQKVKTCGRVCGAKLQALRRAGKTGKPSWANVTQEERMERVKFMAWLKLAKRKGRGAKVDIVYPALVSAWQVIKEIPLVVKG